MNITIDIIKEHSNLGLCHYLDCSNLAVVTLEASFSNGGWIPRVWYCINHLANVMELHMEHDNKPCQWDEGCGRPSVGMFSLNGLYHGPMCVEHSIITIELLR